MIGTVDTTMPVAVPASVLATRLVRALAPARSRDDAAAAIDRVIDDTGDSPYAMRSALAALLDQSATMRALAFPAYDAAREALARIDAMLDRVILAAVATDPVDSLARELATGLDEHRLARSLTVAFDALSPPASHARAVFIDLLRAHELSATRVAIYRHLVSRDTDVRAPLADDRSLDPFARLEVLSAYAAQLDKRGRRLALHFTSDGATSLARTLADWTRYATHPRQIVFTFERQVGDASRTLARIEAWALPDEVRAWLSGRDRGAPIAVRARAVGSGRFECAQCGAVALLARNVRALEDSVGLETVYVCSMCGTEHHASWDDASAASVTREPEAWVAC